MRFYNGTIDSEEVGINGESKLAGSVFSRKTYMIPSQPIAGILKFGIDVKWFDFAWIKYGGLQRYKVVSRGFDFPGSVPNPLPVSVESTYQFDLGMGIGPSINVAPLTPMNNELRFIRVALYGHFIPTASFLVTKVDDENNFYCSFSPTWTFGACINYRRLALGVEARRQSMKYTEIEVSGDEVAFSDKSKFNTKGVRLYIGITL